MKKSLMVVFVLFVLVNLSFGQNYAKQGVVEFTGTVSYTNLTTVYNGIADNSSISMFSISPQLSYFFMNGFQVGLAPTYQSVSNTEFSSMGIYVTPGYVFDLNSNVYPYVSALLGYNATFENSNYSAGGFDFGAMGGIKVSVGKNALINVGLQYLQTTLNPSLWSGKRIGANEFQLLAGFSIFIEK